jgi:FtsZ-interacting cell division protein ZipA
MSSHEASPQLHQQQPQQQLQQLQQQQQQQQHQPSEHFVEEVSESRTRDDETCARLTNILSTYLI